MRRTQKKLIRFRPAANCEISSCICVRSSITDYRVCTEPAVRVAEFGTLEICIESEVIGHPLREFHEMGTTNRLPKYRRWFAPMRTRAPEEKCGPTISGGGVLCPRRARRGCWVSLHGEDTDSISEPPVGLKKVRSAYSPPVISNHFRPVYWSHVRARLCSRTFLPKTHTPANAVGHQ